MGHVAVREADIAGSGGEVSRGGVWDRSGIVGPQHSGGEARLKRPISSPNNTGASWLWHSTHPTHQVVAVGNIRSGGPHGWTQRRIRRRPRVVLRRRAHSSRGWCASGVTTARTGSWWRSRLAARTRLPPAAACLGAARDLTAYLLRDRDRVSVRYGTLARKHIGRQHRCKRCSRAHHLSSVHAVRRQQYAINAYVLPQLHTANSGQHGARRCNIEH